MSLGREKKDKNRRRRESKREQDWKRRTEEHTTARSPERRVHPQTHLATEENRPSNNQTSKTKAICYKTNQETEDWWMPQNALGVNDKNIKFGFFSAVKIRHELSKSEDKDTTMYY